MSEIIDFNKEFYHLAVRRKDGVEVLSRNHPRQRRSLSNLMALAKAINAQPLYAVRVKLKPGALFMPYLDGRMGFTPRRA